MDFDKVINRYGTDSLKYDFATKRGKPEGILPLWVADMDFQVPEILIEKLTERVQHGIFGYSEPDDSYFEPLYKWFSRNHNWEPEKKWLVKTPGIVFAIAMAVLALTKEGEAVLIQQPVYYPFGEVVKDNNRILIDNTLVYKENHYEIDFDDFERKVIENKVKLFVLCNPHNPVGRVWKRDELIRMGDICLKHGVYIFSDEIHCDFVNEGHTHLVFTTLKKEYEEITLVGTAPSKTFNVAGLQISNIFIPNQKIRNAFRHEINKVGYSQLNSLALTTSRTVYEYGQEWLDELKIYLKGNLDYIRDFLRERLPQIQLVEPEGTYLIWLNFKKLNLTQEQQEDLIVKKANLWLDNGTMFGESGEGFERINIACPRSILKQALEQLEAAIKSL